MMPIDVVLVRHGQSEGNVANKRSRKGDHSAFTEEFRNRHSSLFRLTDLGIQQAQAAGHWLRANGMADFERYYVSEYLRAMETAYHLQLPRARWFQELYLRERDWGGELDVLPDDERMVRFGEALQRRGRDGFFWRPPGGETLADVCLRADRILDKWHRECSDKRVIAVCHSEMMWVFRVRLERITARRFVDMDADRAQHLQNGHILHYTRRDPATGLVDCKYLRWVRSICPWDPKRSTNDWTDIDRPVYTNDDLLKQLEAYPRLVND